MAQVQSQQSADGVQLVDDVGNIQYAFGTTLPTGAGYAVGCVFVDSNASAGLIFFVNEGSVTTASFVALTTASAAQTISGAKTFTGTTTQSGASTVTGTATFNDLIEVDFDPSNRVYVRADFGGIAHRRASLDLFIVEGKSASRKDPFWLRSGSGKGSWAAGTHLPTASTDGAMYIQAGKSATSAYTFIKPILGSKLGTIKWNTNKEPRFRAVIRPEAIVQNTIVIGMYSQSDPPDRFKQVQSNSNRIEVFFRSSDSQWRVHLGLGGSSSSAVITSGSVPAADTVQDIEIRVDSSRIVTVLIDSTLIFTATKALASNKALIPIIGLQTLDTAKTSLGIYHVEMSQAISA